MRSQMNSSSAWSIARRHGIDRLEADVLAGNAPMLAVFERSGLPLRRQRCGASVKSMMDLARDKV